MQTHWGDVPVIDSHVHFFSHGFFSALAQERKSSLEAIEAVLGWQLPDEDPGWLADRWVEEMDRVGLARAALVASVPGDEGSVVAAVTKHPTRFYGFFMVNPTQPSPEMHLSSALSTGALQGICLFPSMHRFSMRDDRLTTLLEIAASHPGTVVFVHCGALSVGVRKKLGMESHFDMKYSNPIDLHAVALRFPKLNFIVPHFGAGYFREALMLCDLCPNVYLDTSSSNSWMKYEGIDLRQVFQRAKEVCGAGRLLFGTDSSFFPRGWNAKVYELQSAILAGLGIGAHEARQIFGLNLEGLLKRG
jgi:predicted TIM-barrel fold metal-dependent hydrolase